MPKNSSDAVEEVVVGQDDTEVRSSEVRSIENLRNLLLSPTSGRLDAVEATVKNLDFAVNDFDNQVASHSESLVNAIQKRREDSNDLAAALQPEVVEVLHQSIKEDPNELAEALYPVLGPAVRKLVASLFNPKKANPGQLYSIEQVFTIHRETSLLLNHVVIDKEQAEDADMVSGMLDAVRSFVRDAFHAHEFDGLNTLQVGDVSVWVEWGPQAVLAVVIHGLPPEELRSRFADLLEQMHAQYYDELRAFEGDNEPFKPYSPILELAVKENGPRKKLTDYKSEKARVITIALAIVSFAALVIWTTSGYKWRSFLADLNAEPGVFVISSERSFNSFGFVAMRDPFAKSPQYLMENSRINRKSINAQWKEFQSFDPEIVERRAIDMLRPPESVNFELNGKILRGYGLAEELWLTNLESSAPLLERLLQIKIDVQNINTRL